MTNRLPGSRTASWPPTGPEYRSPSHLRGGKAEGLHREPVSPRREITEEFGPRPDVANWRAIREDYRCCAVNRGLPARRVPPPQKPHPGNTRGQGRDWGRRCLRGAAEEHGKAEAKADEPKPMLARLAAGAQLTIRHWPAASRQAVP